MARVTCVEVCAWIHRGEARIPAHHNIGTKDPVKEDGMPMSPDCQVVSTTETILGRYEDKHDHPIGDENLRFTRMLDTTKKLVMDMVLMGINTNTIVCCNYLLLLHFQTDSYYS